MSHTVVLDGGWSTTGQAEHALHQMVARLGLRVSTACTSFLREPSRVIVRAELDRPLPAGDASAVRVLTSDVGPVAGRAFVFAGSEGLNGVLAVGVLTTRTAIDDVVSMGGSPVDPGTMLNTQGFVRPVYRDGRLVLHTRPAIGGVVVPFEQPNPTPCCADHA